LTSENYKSIFGQLVGLLGCPRRKATTYTGQHNTEKRGHTSTPRAGFEPTMPWTVRPLGPAKMQTVFKILRNSTKYQIYTGL